MPPLPTSPTAGAPNASGPTGVWDQWCVMSEEPYIKMVIGPDGEPFEQKSLLNEENCRRITRTFGAQKDNLPCTLGHHDKAFDKAQFKTAEYSVMVTWKGGKVVEVGSHDPSVQPPTEADLPRPDNGDPPDDGNYVYRCELTDLGRSLWEKKLVRRTSPEFLTDATDQHNNPIGPLAQGLAWTDKPFLDGCESKYERGSRMTKIKMSKHRREAGCMEDEDAAAQLTKIYEHFGKRAMAAAGVTMEDKPEDAITKFERHMEAGDADKDKSQSHPEPDKDNKVAMGQDPIVIPGAPTRVDNPPQANVIMERANREAVAAVAQELQRERAARVEMERQLNDIQTARRKSDAQVAVARAFEAGCIVPRKGETDEAACKRFQARYEKNGEADFRDALAPEGTYVTKAAMSQRLTHNGLSVNFERGGTVQMEAETAGEEILRLIVERKKTNPNEPAHKMARTICMERPDLGAAYRGEKFAALMS